MPGSEHHPAARRYECTSTLAEPLYLKRKCLKVSYFQRSQRHILDERARLVGVSEDKGQALGPHMQRDFHGLQKPCQHQDYQDSTANPNDFWRGVRKAHELSL